MEKDTYDFEAKREYRRLWREFIRGNYPKEKERRGLRVACLPGHEGLEITEVYDTLGIPRHRIYGIEHDPETARKLKALNLGIQIYVGDLADFFRQVDERFNIINLDFQSRCKGREREIMVLIGEKKRTKDRFLFGSNFYGSRESLAYQETMRENTSFSPFRNFLSSITDEVETSESVRQIFRELVGKGEDGSKLGTIDDLGVLRSQDISIAIVNSLVHNVSPRETIDSLGENLEYYWTEKHVSETGVTSQELRNNPEKYRFYLERLRLLDKYNILSLLHKVRLNLDLELKKIFARYKDFSRTKNPKFISDFFKGKYNSDNGSPMFFDFLEIVTRHDLFSPLQIEINPCGNGYFTCPRLLTPEQYAKLILFEQARAKTSEYYLAPREEITIKKASEKAREDLASGISEEEVMQKYGLTKMQIAGHKAVLSRKNGNGQPKKERNRSLRMPSIGEEREIDEFIEVGIDDQSIMTAYGLTRHQVLGRKARLTRRKRVIGNNGNNPTRLEILLRDNYTCQIPGCGLTEEEHKRKHSHGLHEHHIDYNHSNNDPKNRIMLCVTHHAMTNTIQNGQDMKLVLEKRIEEIYKPSRL